MDYKEEIDKTLSSLDSLVSAKAPDSFFEDLNKTIELRKSDFSIPMPLLKIAAIFILFLNLSILYPMGVFDFTENDSAFYLNQEYFSDYNMSVDAYTELINNEE